MKRLNILKRCCCALFLASGLTAAAALAASDGSLREEILAMDAQMFTAFNQRDVQAMGQLFSADLEFYHDKTGLTGREYSLDSLRSLAESDSDLTRELLSTEVYPIPEFGAIQTGEHRFCHTEGGEPDCGVFKFTHIWRKDGQGWKITRVISYDH
ncbi:MAG: nuclear transport factor 2 family protein [Wenzhouxiangella sp.]|jgi:ketosteroid isomerase-like protein|nr:nuclear transport factor 2 family protein [Wenzhouxiangella sp.]